MNEPTSSSSTSNDRTKKKSESSKCFYAFRTGLPEFPDNSEIQGNHDLLTAYGLGPVERAFNGTRRVKEKMSAFLPHVIGELHLDATKEASSLRALIEKPPIHKEISNLSSSAMQGFKLSAGPVDERYRHLFERKQEVDVLAYSEKSNMIRIKPPYDPYGRNDLLKPWSFRLSTDPVRSLTAHVLLSPSMTGMSETSGSFQYTTVPHFLTNCGDSLLDSPLAKKKRMGSRKFAENVPDVSTDDVEKSENWNNSYELLSWMRNDEIGSDAVMEGPFGPRKVVYCDYTASARSFSSIEKYIQSEVLPFYGNTHSSVTVTAEQTTLFMHEAKQEIRAMSGCGDQDSVIFTGSGSTCAVELLVHLLQSEAGNEDVVVIHSIQEHHSNLLPWRKLAKEMRSVEELESGHVDLDNLKAVLKEVRENHGDIKIIGAFCACSNLTGVLIDVQSVTKILKSCNAISIWDYASAAPYIPITFNGETPLDALFFSGHKLPGGVSSPGVLIVKKYLIQATKPKRIGGGTVFFVNDSDEWFLKEVEHREEGGTADAVGAVRLAMAVKMKRAVGEETIKQLEETISRRVFKSFNKTNNLVLLGPSTVEGRLPVLSFLIRSPNSNLFFHHNYISVLLNDLFGIQTRAGCMCAGPYAQKLLGVDEELSREFVNAIQESPDLDRTHLRRQAEYSQQEFLRPGFTRISFPYFFTMQQVDDIVSAVEFVAEHASDFLHLYQVNTETGEWHHQNQRVFHGRRWLGYIQFTPSGLKTKAKIVPDVTDMNTCLRLAQTLALEASQSINLSKIPDGRVAVNEKFQRLRWFVLPIEIAEQRAGRNSQLQGTVFIPRKYSDVPVKQIPEILGKLDEIPKPSENDAKEESTCQVICDDVVCLLKCDDQSTKAGATENVGVDESEAEDVKQMEDWNKRVIVKRIENLRKEEERKQEWQIPPLEMYKKVTDVIHQLKMIRNGDKVLVCLSGGKDSLSLLHILRHYQQRCNKARSTSFQLGAITVDPGSAEFNPRPLIEYCRKLNIDYFYEEQDIIGAAMKTPGLRSICAFCSRMKRGRLAAAAQFHGWNVLAMGQHLDDLAESFFIAAFQNGNLSTMKAQYTTKDNQLRVIRPLIMVREKALRNFAEEKKLPVVAENCPACFNQATERHRIKQLLAQQELIFPDLFNSLRSALKPLLLVVSAHTSEMRTQAVQNIVNSS
ncbi:hypothetical protein L3Y34_001709 [Caenorhabditis briggsae]|uniref:Uncharacterized protein n=2 Tax=Caenorhabditis briggsae TaxID=6238 RepID=A0AAE9IRJ0_CAEBR|nr:hypothetical protein L3Y34_001709 [Caenorhabditis briggsae]